MWAFEKKLVTPDEIDKGPIEAKRLNTAWVLLSTAFIALLGLGWALYGTFTPLHFIALIPIALVLARLAAIDLCYLLLLNVYTLPLFLGAFAYNLFLGQITWVQSILGAVVASVIGLLLTLFMTIFDKEKGEFGAGDVKMLAVMGAWVGLGALPFAFSIAFIMNLILAFTAPRTQAIPFGFGLVIGTWVMVAFKEPFIEGLLFFFS